MAKVSQGTLAALDRASGKLASAALASMDEQFAWFGRMPADQRASVQLIAQTGAAGFTAYLRDQREAIRLTTDAFRQAPRELSRWISLRQTVELVRVALHVIEREVPDLAADDGERQVLTEAVLRYGREVAFTSAMSYASAAETRGAWDARLEASVVDAIVRGDAEESLLSRAAALGWDLDAPATVLVGQLALGRSADRPLRGPQPRRPRRPAGPARGAGLPARRRARRRHRRAHQRGAAQDVHLVR